MTGTEKTNTETSVLIREITGAEEKRNIARLVLEDLTEWFGIPQAREQYISDSADCPFFAAFCADRPVGFICLKQTGKDTAELHVLGVRRQYHRRGIGRKLFEAARDAAAGMGYSFLQVKTVQMGRYEEYDRTNLFYVSLGFREFEVFPDLWDENNPCQVYVMSLR